eukprot:COSAG06_NODE_10651_length_1641_cov_1.865759_3_plen_53_part_01
MPRLRHKRQMLPNLPARLRAFGARAGALTAPPSAPARYDAHLLAMGLPDAPRR